MRSVLFASVAFTLLNFTVAASNANPRIIYARDLFLAKRQDICTENGEVDCYDSCAPVDADCCSDGSGTYCPNGQYCVPDGCCPEGEICSGDGGTITDDNLTGTGSYPTSTAGNAETTAQQATTAKTTKAATTAATVTEENNTLSTAAATKTVTAGNSSPTTTASQSTKTVTAESGNSSGGNGMSDLIHGSGISALLALVAGQLLL